MLNKPPSVQKQILSSVISTEALEAIKLELPENGQLFDLNDDETPTLLKVLDQKFYNQHPWRSRMLAFFGHEQKSNKTPQQFLTALRDLAAEANLQAVTWEQTVIFRFMTCLLYTSPSPRDS